MEKPKSDAEIIRTTHNMARYFVESRQVAWVLLVLTLAWGIFSYNAMDKRKDPIFSNLFAVAACQWPGASAEKVEQLVTRKIEEKISQNMKVVRINSVSRSNVAIVTFKLDDRLKNTAPEFDDIALRLQDIHDLPQGAGPIRFFKDYDDVTNLMLTIASPRASEVDVSLRADAVKKAIKETRAAVPAHLNRQRISIVVCYPYATPGSIPQRERVIFERYAAERNFLTDIRPISGNGFVGVDAICSHNDEEVLKFIQGFVKENLKESFLHPDLWLPAIIHNPNESKVKIAAVAGDKYSYKQLDEYTDLIKRTLQTIPEVSRVTRTGVLDQQVNLEFSQERLASYGLLPSDVQQRINARNIQLPAGTLETAGKNLPVIATGEFKNEKEIGSVLVTTSANGAPVYLKDIVDISRDYESPPRFLSYLTWKDDKGNWQRTRSIVLSVFMRNKKHIDEFGKAVNQQLDELKQRLPEDLVVIRTADQPQQVEDNIDLFMMSLYEAVGLVVLTALIGFWEWRSALLIASSIPLTLTMTYGMMYLLGIDLQQCSIAALIISLGLLVDDPVVAGDSIKRALKEGHPPKIAAWLGPTKLAHAIMFATLTNIAAYLPFLLMSGEVGQFIFSLPIVITCSLIASRIVSMTFVPLLGYYLLRTPPEEKQVDPNSFKAKAKAIYLEKGNWILKHRMLVFATSFVLLICGFLASSQIKTSFFPNDVFTLSWVDVWLPEDAPLSATNDAANHVEQVVKQVATNFDSRNILSSVTTFLGGSGPRFWSSMVPEFNQLNYAQVVVKVFDKHDTDLLIPRLQQALTAAIPEARCDVRQLEGGKPVGMPVAIRISGEDPTILRRYAAQVATMLRNCPIADRVRDDWGSDSLAIKLKINSDRANLAGLTNQDVANSSLVALNGYQIDTLKEGDKEIPIVVRLRSEESAQVQSLNDLYVYSSNSQQKVPLNEVANVGFQLKPEKIRRRNQFRTITVGCFPMPGVLASQIMEQVHPQLDKLSASLPPGYKIEVGGEEEEQVQSFTEMAIIMTVSVISIFLCLVIQFKSAVKPLIVFAAIPYGMLGALVGLLVMRNPFGFPAFMGVASLTGVIVSHVIVLFDFIEVSREEGVPLQEALLHASLVRLRPVLITVAATVLGFIPLAMHGGPLWEPLCYAQIGGLTFATFITLILVPVIYAICVLDLKIVKWEE